MHYKPGNILKFEEDYVNEFLLVLSSKANIKGFYYIQCDINGNLKINKSFSAANYIHYSTFDNLSIVNTIKLSEKIYTKNDKTYTWYLTGNSHIDSYLSHSDDRWLMFKDLAGDKLMLQYRKNEDMNYHAENGKLVNNFCETKILII